MHPRRVSPTTETDGGEYKKHKRRDPPAPKFYDSSADEAASLSGRSRHQRTACLTPSEHQLSPVSGALPLLPEYGTNHEHLIVQSVEKMQGSLPHFPSIPYYLEIMAVKYVVVEFCTGTIPLFSFKP